MSWRGDRVVEPPDLLGDARSTAGSIPASTAGPNPGTSRPELRSNRSIVCATAQPWFTSPITSSSGTSTSSRNSWQNSASPLISLMSSTVTPGACDRDREPGEAAVLGCVPVGAREAHAVVGVVRRAGPDLRAGEDPPVAVAHRARAHAREVGAGLGLREELHEQLVAREHPRDVAGEELRRRVAQHRLPARAERDPAGRPEVGQRGRAATPRRTPGRARR